MSLLVLGSLDWNGPPVAADLPSVHPDDLSRALASDEDKFQGPADVVRHAGRPHVFPECPDLLRGKSPFPRLPPLGPVHPYEWVHLYDVPLDILPSVQAGVPFSASPV